ncbi:MAG: ABATE domain-containing protein [Holophagaceae bacterium]|nr:ABATE domain-containing protein [Holophagaceae bacterium]
MEPVPPAPSPFEFSGGDLALDFVNTWADRARPETDQLGSYPRLVEFAREAKLMDGGQALAREAAAQQDARSASEALKAARRFRESLYGLFSSQAGGTVVDPEDLARVNRSIRSAFPNLEIRNLGEDLAWAMDSGGPVRLDSVLWPIVRAAARLLTSSEIGLVRECEAGDCTWLFLDRSRTGKRRWCSMASCGNRAKARRHYLRQRKV